MKQQSRCDAKSFWLDWLVEHLLWDVLLICVCKLLSTRSDFLLSLKAAYENRRFLARLTEARLKVSHIFFTGNQTGKVLPPRRC